MKNYRIGIDTGGTYTDVVVVDSSSGKVIFSVKELTTHGCLETGIIAALNRLFSRGENLFGLPKSPWFPCPPPWQPTPSSRARVRPQRSS